MASESTKLDVVESPPAEVPAGRAYLLVLEGRETGRRFPVVGPTTIGRGDQAQIRLDDLKASRVHARLSIENGEWRIEDLESHNGTRVNGTSMTAQRIRFGDRIRIGETLLLFAHRDPLEERIRQRQNLEMLGRLGAGVAHDMNNILASVLANAEMLADLVVALEHDARIDECVADIGTAARRGAELTKRIVDQSRQSHQDDATIDLGGLVLEAAELLRRTFDASIRIETTLEPGVCVRGNRGALHQIVMNLFVNARDAMPRGGHLRVRVSSLDPDGLPAGELAFAGRYALVEVEDDGIGIPETVRPRIFEPFFTTKPSDRGSGLGLATVAEIVAEHGGRVTFDSEVLRGTTFRVVLPALATTTSVRPSSSTPLAVTRPQRIPTTSQSVMLVDDDALVRRAIARVLSNEGLRVVEAGDGRAALVALAAQGDDVGLVILDLDMPELDGESTFDEMRASGRTVPVLFLTGRCDDVRKQSLLARGARGVLAKPCSSDVLRRVVRTELGAWLTPSGT